MAYIRLTESDLHRIIRKSVNRILNEAKSRQDKEQMLVDLYNYLAQEPTDDIYDGGKHGKLYVNIIFLIVFIL